MGKELTAVSLFSGCGGFDWGAQQAGVKIIWANDIDSHAAAAYQAIFPNVEFVLEDICNVKKFPQADILIGCYPCTGFSVAARRSHWRQKGKRDLLADDGNFLYKEFLRALSQINPKYLFVENVVGMLTAENGWFLKQQLRGFRARRYKVQYATLQACDYGVAQSRKRVFIVGIRRDASSFKYEFPQPIYGPNGTLPYVVLRDIISQMEAWPDGEYCDRPFHGHYLTRNRKRGWDQLSYTIVANERHVPLHPMGDPMKFIKKDTWALQGEFNRRLSWRECAAIQGLPTQAVPSGSLEDRYRVIGNAVPPAFGKALLQQVVSLEG